jgi:hypothetical protein
VTLGADTAAVWGECQGSGAKPYQAQVDLAALASRCSCPSRKFPCKHGLALLLLYAQPNPRFAAAAARPAWVEDWLASRRGRAEKKEKAAEVAAARTAANPAASDAAAAKREGTRWTRIESGTADLQRWIADQFRGGLARFGPDQRRDWAAMAARMIDAQAPGLAPRLQQALDLMNTGPAQAGRVIEIFGLLQLINEGVRRRGQLTAAREADLRAALGWPLDKEDVIAAGEAVADQWRVLGQVIAEPDAKLSERRVWLQGVTSGRYALLQEFAYGGRGWERSWRHGAHYQATLKFFPGSVPLRALAVEVSAAAMPQAWQAAAAEAAWDSVSQACAANPWLSQVPLVLDAATPFYAATGWHLHTAAGTAVLRIAESAGWSLLAFSGGHPVGVMGEWDGSAVQLLNAWDAQGAQWTPEAVA